MREIIPLPRDVLSLIESFVEEHQLVDQEIRQLIRRSINVSISSINRDLKKLGKSFSDGKTRIDIFPHLRT